MYLFTSNRNDVQVTNEQTNTAGINIKYFKLIFIVT